MKRIFTLLIITCCFVGLNAQTVVDFTEGEGFVTGQISGQNNWGGANWFVYPEAAKEKIMTTSGYSWVFWGQPFSLSANEVITFSIDFKFTGAEYTSNSQVARFGFNSSNTTKDKFNIMYVSMIGAEGGLQLRNMNNMELQFANDETLSASLIDWQGIDLRAEITLSLGADAASSVMSGKLINVSNGTETAVGSYTGIDAGLYAAATGNGVYGTMQSQAIAADKYFNIMKVTMTEGTPTAISAVDRQEFVITPNPSTGIVKLKGLEANCTVSVYSISGKMVYTTSYNGTSIDLSQLPKGLYVMNVDGYTSKLVLR